MSATKRPMRYAHSEGHTDMCFDESGRFMLTGGDDGDVRIWEGIEGDDSVSHVGNKVYALLCSNGRFYTANEMNSIQAYTFPDCSPDGIIARFTAPVTHMSLNSAGNKLSAGSSDFTIKVIDLQESMSTSFLGHDAPVLCVMIDPKEEFLASSSCDGTIRIWRMDTQTMVKSLPLITKSNDFSLTKTLCRLQWEPKTGKNLIVPVSTSIEIYSRSDWTKKKSLTDDSIKQEISVLSFSSDDRYLAAACRDGVIVIWDWPTKTVCVRTSHDRNHTITALVWNPRINNQIAFCDNQGQLCLIDHVVPQSSPILVGSTDDGNNLADVFGDDDDFPLSGEGTKQKLGDSDSDDGLSDIIGKPRRVEDDASDKASLSSDIKATVTTPQATVTPTYVGPKPTPLQSPFQPSSTPEHLTSRFMKWNSVGVIRQYNSDDETSIDVEFHDASVHHAMHLSNPHSFTMADLSTEAVLLASQSDEDQSSKLQCLHFGSWDNCREWTIDMPDDEDIEAIVIGDTWVAAATDTRLIRFFTLSGVQLDLISISGPVVCLAAFNNYLFVIYHRSVGVPGDQCLACQIINVKGEGQSTDLVDLSLPLSPKSTLSWAGFSVQGTPFTCDSFGCVRMLNRRLANTWTPVANTQKHTKGKSDHYWIVGISENPQQIRCIPCKGSRYPPTLPRPAVAVLPFELPLCDLHMEKTQYEEVYHRSHLLTHHLDHWSSLGYDIDDTTKTDLLKPAQEAFMKLFALSVRSEREFRAVELCEMMKGEHTLQLAIKYATRLKRLQLAQRISELARERAAEELERQEEMMNHTDGTSQELFTQNDDVIMSTDAPFIPGPMLKLAPKKPPSTTITSTPAGATNWTNPFKLMSQDQSHTVFKGSQVFDEMKTPTNKLSNLTPISPPSVISNVKKTKVPKKTNQGKLFANQSTNHEYENSKPVSAFDLWLGDNMDDLRNELADSSEEDVKKVATQRFQQLPRDQKQIYLQKARAAKNPDKTSKDLENKKRKRDIESNCDASSLDDISQKKLKNCDEGASNDTNVPTNEIKAPLKPATNTKLLAFSFNKPE